jgi:long-subunit fatty acid transport protein
LSSAKALRRILGVAASFALALGSTHAAAAGFDTPILYTARHQAMGGAAIGYVDDPSAGFHNPAGLQGVRGLGLLGDFSLILGKVQGSPFSTPTAHNLESKLVVAPFFLLGGAYRVHEWVTVGLAAFPVASGGAEYEYDIGTLHAKDSTEIVFFEATPLLSLNVPKDRWLPGKLAFGAGYRASMVMFDRVQGDAKDPQLLDLSLSGFNWAGVRLGVQYSPVDALKLGVVFRNKIVVKTTADTGTVGGAEASDGQLKFRLPAKLGFGARFDWARVGVASDVEWAFQNQNPRSHLTGTLHYPNGDVQPADKVNVFDWQNGVTWRLGFEYRLGAHPLVPLRIGYIYDTKVTNKAYPSAFGTPPAPTHTLTAGAGYVAEHWQVNLAASRRFGSAAHVDASELGTGCNFCGFAGDYKITMTGLYIDASVDLPR